MADNQWNDELRGPEGTPRQPNRSGDQWDDAPPPKAGMSSGMKVFLILVAILGCCCVVCCGVVGFLGYSFMPKVSQNAADVNAAKDEMAQITLLAGFEPNNMVKMDNMMMSMIAVSYHNPAVHGEITMAEFRLKVGNAKQQDEQMHQQLERQGFGNPKRPHEHEERCQDDLHQRPGVQLQFQNRDRPRHAQENARDQRSVSREAGTRHDLHPDGRFGVQRRCDRQNAGGD